MKEDLKYQDLCYFGYDYPDESADSIKRQELFIEEIHEKFQNVMLHDAYDNIKGFRKEVFLEDTESDNYYAWVIANGWIGASFTLTFMTMMEGEQNKLEKYNFLAKQQYPLNFIDND